jgi:arginyl-tRNA--protein-N-Asp/Glu arginylyltransferase
VSGRLLATTPPEIVVRDEEDVCVYLPGRRARQPLRQPIRRLTAAEFDTRLAAGDRRAGSLLYNQACPSCAECQAIRVDVGAFAPSRSQRRAQAKGDGAVTVELGPIVVDDTRIALYRAHEHGRGLDHGGGPPIDALGYESFFAHSCVEGLEVRYLVGGELRGVAITDRGARSLSAVYTFWDPAYAALALGTYSILTQIALARAWDLDWLYLGLAVRENRSMAYKLAFMPHERRVGGAWQRFSRG